MGRQRHTPSTPLVQADPSEDRRFVTALARGLTVLRSFGPSDRWLAHQELARRTGLPQATVSRLTFTLTSLGYLRHRAPTGEYALSPAVLSLGFSVLSNFQIGHIARPFMETLAEHTQAAISLGLRHDTSVVYVAHCRSTARLILGLDVGTRLPFAETAMGRAIWCSATPGIQAVVARRLRAQDPERWPAREAGLHRAEVDWADVIFVMERQHKVKLSSEFKPWLRGKRVVCLNIPDNYKFMDPTLVQLLERKVLPFLPRG